MSKKLEIPVGAAFEKRLAELVWENCPELARQTAAGRMALAIDVTDSETIETATDKAIDGAVAQLVAPLIEAAKPELEKTATAHDVEKKVRDMLEEKLTVMVGSLHKRIESAVEGEIAKAITKKVMPKLDNAAIGFFNERPLARTVRERLEQLITDYLREKLEPEKSGRGVLVAAEEEMVTRVADALGRIDDRESV